MNINTVFPSKYLKAEELDGDATYTISSVTIENVGTKENPESKPVIEFAETDKGMVCNKTNANTIAGLYGPDTDAWIGKPVTLFATEVDFQGSQVLAIRVRMRKPVAKAATVATPPPSNALLVAARRKAWDALKAQFPEKSDQDLTPMWRDVMAIAVPERQPSTFGLAEWSKVHQAITAGTNPIDSAEPAFAADDIPF